MYRRMRLSSMDQPMCSRKKTTRQLRHAPHASPYPWTSVRRPRAMREGLRYLVGGYAAAILSPRRLCLCPPGSYRLPSGCSLIQTCTAGQPLKQRGIIVSPSAGRSHASQQAFLTGLAHLYNLIPYQRRAQHAGQCGVEVEGGRVPTHDWFLNVQILTSGGFR